MSIFFLSKPQNQFGFFFPKFLNQPFPVTVYLSSITEPMDPPRQLQTNPSKIKKKTKRERLIFGHFEIGASNESLGDLNASRNLKVSLTSFLITFLR